MLTLSVKKFFDKGNNPYYRSLRIHVNHSRIIYRFPYQYDNDNFIQKLCEFIENDLKNNAYEDLNENINNFFVDVIGDQIQFVDRVKFYSRETQYLQTYFTDDSVYSKKVTENHEEAISKHEILKSISAANKIINNSDNSVIML